MAGPIDAVVLWVDGSDPEWRLERFNQWKIYFNQCVASNADHRFANCDELVYCLRSLYFNAPWIRNIYLVTCGQKPKWLDKRHPRITLIDHRQIIDRENLPTFNSCAIEMHLHRIPGLSECFLYLNDDCFIAKRTTKRHFFHANGKAYFNSHRLMQNNPNCNEINSFNWTIRNNQECLDKLFDKKVRYRPDHQAYLVFKKACQHVERNAQEYVSSTRHQRFRIDSTKNEKTLNMYAFATAGLELGYYELKLNADELYNTVDQARDSYHKILSNTPMLLCINNAHTDNDRLFVHQLMSSLLPNSAPWEIPNTVPWFTPLKLAQKRKTKCKILRPSDKFNKSYLLFQPSIPRNSKTVIYQLKNQKNLDDVSNLNLSILESNKPNPAVHKVEFYLPPKYINTHITKTRNNPTTINKNKTKLYHHIGSFKDMRSLMSIPN